MNSNDELIQNAQNYLTDAINSLSSLRVLLNTLNGGDDDALESGAAGSGRFKDRVGSKTADLVSEAAQRASRRARRENTLQSHTAAGDLHMAAAKEMRSIGESDRAEQHANTASGHYKIAKILQAADLNAANAGHSVVPNPKGSDPAYTDRSQYDNERERNLSEGGGAPGGDELAQKRADGTVECPLCTNIFDPEKSVSGTNSAYLVCPRCHGSFRLADGRSVGVPSEE